MVFNRTVTVACQAWFWAWRTSRVGDPGLRSCLAPTWVGPLALERAVYCGMGGSVGPGFGAREGILSPSAKLLMPRGARPARRLRLVPSLLLGIGGPGGGLQRAGLVFWTWGSCGFREGQNGQGFGRERAKKISGCGGCGPGRLGDRDGGLWCRNSYWEAIASAVPIGYGVTLIPGL